MSNQSQTPPGDLERWTPEEGEDQRLLQRAMESGDWLVNRNPLPLAEANMNRAKIGLPPISPEEYERLKAENLAR
jgi:hypothetical protein